MKTSSFLSGLAVGAVAAIAITKKLKALCADEDDSCGCENDADLKVGVCEAIFISFSK